MSGLLKLVIALVVLACALATLRTADSASIRGYGHHRPGEGGEDTGGALGDRLQLYTDWVQANAHSRRLAQSPEVVDIFKKIEGELPDLLSKGLPPQLETELSQEINGILDQFLKKQG